MSLKIRKSKKVKIIVIISIIAIMSIMFNSCGATVNTEEINKAVEEALRAAGVYSENNDISNPDIIQKSTTDNQAKNNASNQNKSSINSGDDFDAELIASELSAQMYILSGYYAMLEVENTSKFCLDITVNLQTFDSSGNLLSSEKKSETAIRSEMKTVFIFFLDENFADYSYEFDVEQNKYDIFYSTWRIN